MKTQHEVLDRGYKALVDALGIVDAIRFIRHFSPGYGDYTKERHQWLDKLSAEELFAEMRQQKQMDRPDDFEEFVE